MAQETTEAFGRRFTQAVEGHPLAPPTPHGRQRWMLDKLERETGLSVSANTMSKWFHGQAMPRGDNVRKIAQVLKVDEVWLALGRKPVMKAADAELNVAKARGATLAFAGLIEMEGGRVTFSSNEAEPADIHVNLDGHNFSAVVVSPQISADKWSFIVPEPIGDARIVSVFASSPRHPEATVCLSVLDLTACPRQTLGGYSIITLETRKDGKFKAEGQRALISPVAKFEELSGA